MSNPMRPDDRTGTDEQAAAAVRRLTIIQREAAALTELDTPVLRRGGGRIVAISSELLAALDTETVRDHPVRWE